MRVIWMRIINSMALTRQPSLLENQADLPPPSTSQLLSETMSKHDTHNTVARLVQDLFDLFIICVLPHIIADAGER